MSQAMALNATLTLKGVATLHLFFYALSLLAPWTSALASYTLLNLTQLAFCVASGTLTEVFPPLLARDTADLHQRVYALSMVTDLAALFCAERLSNHALKFSFAMAVLNLVAKAALFSTVATDARGKGAGDVFSAPSATGGGGGPSRMPGEAYTTLVDGPPVEYRPPVSNVPKYDDGMGMGGPA